MIPKNKWILISLILSILFAVAFRLYWLNRYHYQGVYSPPLVMEGGDPYIRALMRTISASEANNSYPYAALYGGDLFSDFSHHPNACKTILTRVNRGNCSTAAGRYQLLESTWLEKSKQYLSQQHGAVQFVTSDFSPSNQDEVVYQWLTDNTVWHMDIGDELAAGHLPRVLQKLSGTWTSLGYGIENNSNSRLLPKVYAQILREEKKQVTHPLP